LTQIADRSPSGLVDGLCGRITKVLAPSYWHRGEHEDEEYHTPVVHAQYLPITLTADKERDKSKDYPLVQVFCLGGEIGDFAPVAAASAVSINCYFGAFHDGVSNQGWRLAQSMMWRVLIDLLGDTIIGAYQLKPPVKWSLLGKEDEKPPYYTALLETAWRGCPPAEETPAVF
jgi:hypothetical protein